MRLPQLGHALPKRDGLALFRVLYVAIAASLLAAQAIAAEPIRKLTNMSATNVRPAWSPDGQRIAFQSNRDGPYGIWIIDRDGSNPRKITNASVDDRHPSWSPDGKYVAVDSGSAYGREIWIIDVATSARTQVTKIGAIASFPSFSPDGQRLTFYVYRSGTMDVWIVGRDGSAPTQLTKSLASESRQQCTFACHSVAWSPDGKRIALSDGDNARVLLMAPLVESAVRPISPEGERNHFPAYLSDGRLTYVTEFLSLDESWTDIWIADPETGARTELARRIQAQGPFELTADGKQLLFASPRSGNFEIYSVTLDEAGKAALATRPSRGGPSFDAMPGAGVTSADSPPFGATPEMLALGTIVLLVLGIELTVLLRRRRRARG